MKKFITVLFALFITTIMFSQVKYNKPKESEYDTKAIGYHMIIDRYISTDAYILRLYSTNQFETQRVDIGLGKGKTIAVESLNAILQMMTDTKKDGHFTIEEFPDDYRFYNMGNGQYECFSLRYAAGDYIITRQSINAAIAYIKNKK